MKPHTPSLVTDAPAPALTGVVLLLAVLCLRVLVANEPTPGWSGDPLTLESPVVGLTPAGSLILDAITLLGSALILTGMGRLGERPPLWQTLCLAAGGVAVSLHARVLPDASMDNLVLGSSWIAAFVGAFAVTQASRHTRLRALVVAALLALMAPLMIKGVVQYSIEQPETVREFVRNKEQILSANGWTTDSPMARAYQRRLEQPEATGWFGLANVFATVAAASLAGLVGSSASFNWLRGQKRASESDDKRWRLVAGAGLALAIAGAGTGVILAGSKGGYAAAALGLGLVFASSLFWRLIRFVRSRDGVSEPGHEAGANAESAGRAGALRIGSIAAVVIPAMALLAVCARGLMGERLRELSLLFRWFYLETAARIFAAHPLLGTGPDGFKTAYMFFKPALSPEDVSSPHSILFDLASRLGVGGVALAALLVAWVWRAGRGLVPVQFSGAPEHDDEHERRDMRLLLIVIAAGTASAAILEQPAATLTSTFVRAGGLFGFMLVGAAVLHVMRHPSAAARFALPGLAAAAIVAFTHSQIELTGVTPGASLWVLLIIGAAAGSAPVDRSASGSGPRWFAVGLPFILLALIIPFGVVPAAKWDAQLRLAYSQVELVPSFAMRADAIARGRPFPRDSAGALAADLTRALGAPVTPANLQAAVNEFRYQRAAAAGDTLLAASSIRPSDSETVHSATRLMIEIAGMDEAMGRPSEARSIASEAEQIADTFCRTVPPSPEQYAWLGVLRRSRYELDHDPGHLKGAIDAWKQAAEFGPHEPLYALQIARAYKQLNQPDRAATWARKALDANQDLRLDPFRQFAPKDLDELTAMALESGPGEHKGGTP